MGLDLTGFGKVADVLGAVFDKVSHFIPDPIEKEKARQAATELAQREDFKLLDAMLQSDAQQAGINKIEAASASLFVSGWRPAVGWAGAVALALVYWPKAIMLTAIWTYQCLTVVHGNHDPAHLYLPAFPDLGVTDLLGLLGSLLGFGTIRMAEKLRGVAAR